ncbi:uncharacterized protein LOC120123317 [Hibiscus syriacus]|uniref:uncharacterized protein LOC120123317 n=1 Tax=Hibiscus syriacus TaxID=106335 RepID=UPI001921F77A|nr:uncharacterized protein LOC120123317 [Hibiscus syriacus]
MSDKGRPLPKFGEWDVNDPASAEGFTVIFNKARTRRKPEEKLNHLQEVIIMASLEQKPPKPNLKNGFAAWQLRRRNLKIVLPVIELFHKNVQNSTIPNKIEPYRAVISPSGIFMFFFYFFNIYFLV